MRESAVVNQVLKIGGNPVIYLLPLKQSIHGYIVFNDKYIAAFQTT